MYYYLCTHTVTLLVTLWKDGGGDTPTQRNWILGRDNSHFHKKFDKIQELEELCGLDDLLTGVLSKSKGQILPLAACMNALFSLDPLHPLKAELSPTSIDASIDYVEVCIEHTSVMGGQKNTTSLLSCKLINPNCMYVHLCMQPQVTNFNIVRHPDACFNFLPLRKYLYLYV